MCSQLDVIADVARRRPSGMRTIASACGALVLNASCHCVKSASVGFSVSSPCAHPPAGASGNHRFRAARAASRSAT